MKSDIMIVDAHAPHGAEEAFLLLSMREVGFSRGVFIGETVRPWGRRVINHICVCHICVG